MALDAFTLAMVSAVGGLLMFLALAGTWAAGTREPAVASWAGAGLVLAIGYFIGALAMPLGRLAPTWLFIAVANGLIGASHAAILIGIHQSLGRRPPVAWLAAVVCIVFVAGLLVPELRESIRARVVVQSIAYVLMDLLGGWMLWNARQPGLTAFRRAAAAVLLARGLFLLARWVWMVGHDVRGGSFVHDAFQTAVYPVTMTLGILIAIALVILLFRGKELALRAAAERDPLTGTLNRVSLGEHLRDAAVAPNAPTSVISVDVDHFKAINDRWGHPVGDTVLCAIATAIQSVLRASDELYRIGGEEFLVLLRGSSAVEARAAAERILHRVRDLHCEAIDGLPLTVSLGVAQCRSGESWDMLMRRVDTALYEAKHAGRDRVLVALDDTHGAQPSEAAAAPASRHAPGHGT